MGHGISHAGTNDDNEWCDPIAIGPTKYDATKATTANNEQSRLQDSTDTTVTVVPRTTGAIKCQWCCCDPWKCRATSADAAPLVLRHSC